MKTTPIPDAKWQRLVKGRLTVREICQYRPRLKLFTTRYAACLGGIVLKTRQGTFFHSPERARQAGRAAQQRLRST